MPRMESFKTKQIGDNWLVVDDLGLEIDGPFETEWDAMATIKEIVEPWWRKGTVH